MNCKKCKKPGVFSGAHKVCNCCRAKRGRRYYRTHRTRKLSYYQEHKTQINDKVKLKKYGVTPEMFRAMLAEQEGLCRICDTKMAKPVIDHDHKTGAVRGLLCGMCNCGIGCMKDSPKICESAALYLKFAGKEDTGN